MLHYINVDLIYNKIYPIIELKLALLINEMLLHSSYSNDTKFVSKVINYANLFFD